MAIASGPAGPVLVGPVLTLAFKTARAQGLMGVASRELLRLDHIASPVGGRPPPFYTRPAIARPPVRKLQRIRDDPHLRT